jgi:hypothetical protein
VLIKSQQGISFYFCIFFNVIGSLYNWLHQEGDKMSWLDKEVKSENSYNEANGEVAKAYASTIRLSEAQIRMILARTEIKETE